jgi:hypothetical protein
MLTLIIEKCVIVEFHRFQADYVLILWLRVWGESFCWTLA